MQAKSESNLLTNEFCGYKADICELSRQHVAYFSFAVSGLISHFPASLNEYIARANNPRAFHKRDWFLKNNMSSKGKNV